MILSLPRKPGLSLSPKQHFLPLEKSGKRRLWELSIQGIVLFKTKVNDDIPAVCGKTKQRYVASDREVWGWRTTPLAGTQEREAGQPLAWPWALHQLAEVPYLPQGLQQGLGEGTQGGQESRVDVRCSPGSWRPQNQGLLIPVSRAECPLGPSAT